MQQQKQEADKCKKKRKEEEKKPHKKNNQNGNRNSKCKTDWKATRGPTLKCKKHPNSNHAWGNCNLNPNNPNNKLGDQNFVNRNRNRNFNQNQNQNNQQYRNCHQNDNCQRQSFYGNRDNQLMPPPPPPRDNYSNQGPPSLISTHLGGNYMNNDQPKGKWDVYP